MSDDLSNDVGRQRSILYRTGMLLAVSWRFMWSLHGAFILGSLSTLFFLVRPGFFIFPHFFWVIFLGRAISSVRLIYATIASIIIFLLPIDPIFMSLDSKLVVGFVILVRLSKYSFRVLCDKIVSTSKDVKARAEGIFYLALKLTLIILESQKITRAVLFLQVLIFLYPLIYLGFLWLMILPIKIGAQIAYLVGVPQDSSISIARLIGDLILEGGKELSLYFIPLVVSIYVAFMTFLSLATRKKRSESVRSLSAAFLELLISGAIVIHYLNILFPQDHHYKLMAWPGQNLESWISNWDVYLLSIFDSLFISATSITLLGITSIELVSYPARAFYVFQAFIGLYFIVFAIRRLKD